MRIVNILILSLCFISNTTAQQKFSQKDFNKLKILSEEWFIQSNSNIYEKWEVANDSTMKGIRYEIVDTNYIPEAKMTLFSSNNEIKIIYNFIDSNNNTGINNILHLKSIKNSEYFFNNDDTDNPTPEEKRDNIKEKICRRISFKFDGKNKIEATRMLLHPGKGIFTEIYLYVKK